MWNTKTSGKSKLSPCSKQMCYCSIINGKIKLPEKLFWVYQTYTLSNPVKWDCTTEMHWENKVNQTVMEYNEHMISHKCEAELVT